MSRSFQFLKCVFVGILSSLFILNLNAALADEKPKSMDHHHDHAPAKKPAPSESKKAVRKQHVHDHGAAKLDIAVDGTTVAIEFESPAHDLYGFEYEPKSEGEKKIAADVNKKLKDEAATIFSFPAALGCKLVSAEVKGLGMAIDSKDASAKKDEHKDHGHEKHAAQEVHSDVDYEVEFKCTVSPAGAKMKVGLAKAFPKLNKIKVAVPGRTSTKIEKSELTLAEEEVQL